MSDFDKLRDYWDKHAQRDPLWAVLSDPSKSGGRWDVGRFFQTGVNEIASVFYQLDSRRIAFPRRTALDFGCGVGRLTQALAARFERVVGVDVSPRMVELAESLNAFPSRVTYLDNQRPDLSVLGDASFDFVITNIVLQHLEPDLALTYLAEFFRVTSPGGVLVFQLPSHLRPTGEHPPASGARAMTDEAYQASLGVTGVEFLHLEPGAEITLDVAITNASPIDWDAREYGVMRVGNHWLSRDGERMLNRDDGRSNLPGLLRSGETCRVALAIRAPEETGEYRGAIDIAHEGVVWFHDKGSAVPTFPVRVGSLEEAEEPASGEGPAPPAFQYSPERAIDLSAVVLNAVRPDDADVGEFPMHGLPQSRVVDLIAHHGGSILHIEDDSCAGEEWVSYRYYVRNAGALGA